MYITKTEKHGYFNENTSEVSHKEFWECNVFFTVNYSITFLLSPKAVNLTVFYSTVFYCKGRLRSNTFSIFSNETYFNQLLFLQSLSRLYFFFIILGYTILNTF